MKEELVIYLEPMLSPNFYRSLIWTWFAAPTRSSKMDMSFSRKNNWSLYSQRLIIVTSLTTRVINTLFLLIQGALMNVDETLMCSF